MRMFKKFFLAAGLVGVIGTFGLTQEAMAANEVSVDAELDTATNALTWSWTNNGDNAYELATKAVYTVGGQEFTETGLAVKEAQEGGEYTCNIDDHVSSFTTPSEGDTVKGQVKVVITVEGEEYDDQGQPTGKSLTPGE